MDIPHWEKRRLGRTGLRVTPLGIGGAYLGRLEGGHDEAVNLGGLLGGSDPMQLAAGWAPDWPRREQMWAEAQRAHVLWEWAQARGISLLALNLQYCLREPRIASTLIGFSRPSRVDEDVAACFEPIAEDVWQELPQVLAEIEA